MTKKYALPLLALCCVFSLFLSPMPAYAVDDTSDQNSVTPEEADRVIDKLELDGPTTPDPGILDADRGLLSSVLGVVFGGVGALSVLYASISGLRYVLSGGDPQKTAMAKDGLLYAIIGLFISLSGFAIVRFVINQL